MRMIRHAQPKLFSSLNVTLVVVPMFFVAIGVLDWIGSFGLTPDSTNYLIAAHNLIQIGQLKYYVNFTNWEEIPRLILYMEQPPGFPLFLAPFTVLSEDLTHAAAIAQALAIGLLAMSMYGISLRLRLSPLSLIVFFLLFAFLMPLRLIQQTLWSETLFIATVLGTGYFALGTSRKDRLGSIILLVVSTSIRYTGLANIGWLAPTLFTQSAWSAWKRTLFQPRVGLGAALGSVALILLTLLGELLPNADPGIGKTQTMGVLLGAAGILLGLLVAWYSRRLGPTEAFKESSAGEAQHWLDRADWTLMAVAAAFAPMVMWFARNLLLTGQISLVNRPFQVFLSERVWGPFEYILDYLLPGSPHVQLLVSMMVILALVLPLVDESRFASRYFPRHRILLSALAGHFVLTWILTVVTMAEPIGHRLFSPVLAVSLLAMVHATQFISQRVRQAVTRHAILLAPLILLLGQDALIVPRIQDGLDGIRYPRERALWRSIYSNEWAREASHYYTDGAYLAGGFIHQIYSQKPQGILWDIGVLKDPDRMLKLFTQGTHPFVVVTQNGTEASLLESAQVHGQLPLGKISYHALGFVVYFLEQ